MPRSQQHQPDLSMHSESLGTSDLKWSRDHLQGTEETDPCFSVQGIQLPESQSGKSIVHAFRGFKKNSFAIPRK